MDPHFIPEVTEVLCDVVGAAEGAALLASNGILPHTHTQGRWKAHPISRVLVKLILK